MRLGYWIYDVVPTMFPSSSHNGLSIFVYQVPNVLPQHVPNDKIEKMVLGRVSPNFVGLKIGA